MAEKRVTIRAAVEGGDKAKADLNAIGAAGDKAMGGVGKGANDAARPLSEFTKETGRAGSVSRQTAAQLQNAGYQFQDIAVQIAGGTSASRALSQQLPQLLSGFGLLGVMLGTVSAVAVPLAAMFLSTGEGARSFEERVDDLRTAIDDYQSAADRANLTQAALTERYAAASAEARVFLGVLREISGEQALSAARSTAQGIATMFGGFDPGTADRAMTGLTEMQATIERIKGELGLSHEEARQFAAALRDLKMADGADEYVAALRNVSDLMEAVTAEGDEQQAKFQQVREQIALAGDTMASLVGATYDATGATEGWAAAMASVRSEIGAIASALSQMGGGMIQNAGRYVELNALRQGRSVAEASRERQRVLMEAEFSAREMAAGTWVEKLAIRAERGLAAKGMELDAELDAARSDAREAARAAGRSSGGGRRGGRGGGRAAREERPLFEGSDKRLAALQREIEMLGKSSEEAATAKARWEMLDEVKRRGVPLNAEINAQIEAQATQFGQLTGELERAQLAQDRFDEAISGIADAFSSALIEGESLRDGLASVLAGIASDILNSGIRNALLQTFNVGGGGGLFGMLSGFLGGGGDPLSAALGAAGAPVRVMHSGGIVGIDGGVRSGWSGLRPNEVPAILERGERVLSRRDVARDGMTYAPTVHVGGNVSAADLAAVRRELAVGFQQMRRDVPGIVHDHQRRHG